MWVTADLVVLKVILNHLVHFLKMPCNSKSARQMVKLIEVRHLGEEGVLIEHIWDIFDLVMFKVIRNHVVHLSQKGM